MHAPIPLALLAPLQAAEGAAGGLLSGQLPELTALIRAAFLAFVGLPLVYALSKAARGWISRQSTPQRG